MNLIQICIVSLFMVKSFCGSFDDFNSTIHSDGNLLTMIFIPMESFLTQPQYGLLITEAIKYTHDIGNEDLKQWVKQSKMMKLNITFGYRTFDTSFTHQKSQYDFVTSILDRNEGCEDKNDEKICIGYVGNITNDLASFGLHLLAPYQYPLVSLSHESAARNPKQFPQYFRLSGVNDWMFLFLVQLMQHYDWRYVGLVSSDDTYGQEGRYKIASKLQEFDICLGFDIVYSSESDIQKLSDILKEDVFLKVIILWLSADDFLTVFKQVEEHRLYNITWIAGPEITDIPEYMLAKINPNIFHGTIVLADNDILMKDLSSFYYSGFPKHFWSLSLQNMSINPWLKCFYDKHNLNESSNITLGSYRHLFPPSLLVLVNNYLRTQKTFHYIVKQALRKAKPSMSSLKKEIVSKSTGYRDHNFFWPRSWFTVYSYLGYIVNMSSPTFQMHQMVISVIISKTISSLKWSDMKGPIWTGFSYMSPIGRCSDVCPSGKFPVIIRGRSCCWQCIQCKDSYIKANTNQTQCQRCPLNSVSNINRTSCLFFKDTFIKYTDKTAINIQIIQSVGILLTLFILITFLVYFNTPVVKSSIRNLSIVQFILHIILYTFPTSTLGPLTTAKCIYIPLYLGITLVMIAGIIYIKVDYIHIIFKAKTKLHLKTISRQQSRNFFILFVVVLTQIVIFLTHNQQVPIYVDVTPVRKTLENQLWCANAYQIVSQYAFIITLLIICNIKAYQVRRLPRNFNSSKSIMYATLCTLVVLLVAPVIYHGQIDVNGKMIAMNLSVLLANTTILLLMYSYKLWIIYFRPEQNTTRALVRYTFEIMKKRVQKEMSNASNKSSFSEMSLASQ